MRFVTLVVALSSLLQPLLSVAQCDEQEWVNHITPVAPTTSALANSFRTVHSKVDGSWYWINGLGGSTVNQANLSGDTIQCPPCVSQKNFLLQKYNSQGELLWSRFGCFGNALAIYGMTIDNHGNLIFGGFFQGELSYEGTTLGQSEVGINSHFTVKISSSGELSWFRHGNKSVAANHVITEHGLLLNLIVVDSTSFDGVTYSHSNPIGSQSNQAWLLMVDENGAVQWSHRMEGSGNRVIRNITCSAEHCVVHGNFVDEIVYQDQTLSGGNGGRFFQLAINPEQGDFLWMKKQSNSGTVIYDNVSTIVGDSVLFTAGFYNGIPSEFTFEGSTITSANGLTDGFIMQQSVHDGQLRWMKTLGAPGYSNILGIDSTVSGIVITGHFTCAELNYEGVSILNHSEQEDPFVLIIDQDGKPSCHLSGIGSSTRELGTNVWTDGNSMYLTLNFVESAVLNEVTIVETGGNSQLVWKTCLPCDTLTSITEASKPGASLAPYPNPATHTVRLQVSGSRFQVRSVVLTDMLGNSVLNLEPGTSTLELDVSGLASGVYTVAATLQNGEMLRQRLVVGR